MSKAYSDRRAPGSKVALARSDRGPGGALPASPGYPAATRRARGHGEGVGVRPVGLGLLSGNWVSGCVQFCGVMSVRVAIDLSRAAMNSRAVSGSIQ
jgi:hypothetical protein